MECAYYSIIGNFIFGKSLYNQDDINKICNNANSLYKKALDGKCPFDLVEKYIPLDELKILGFKRIDEDKIN